MWVEHTGWWLCMGLSLFFLWQPKPYGSPDQLFDEQQVGCRQPAIH